MSAHIVGPGSPWALAAGQAVKLPGVPAAPPRYPDWAFAVPLWRLSALLRHPIVSRATDKDAAPCRDVHVLSVRADARGELVASHRPLWPGRCPMSGRRPRWRRLHPLPAHEQT